jgi:hypothetical protein
MEDDYMIEALAANRSNHLSLTNCYFGHDSSGFPSCYGSAMRNLLVLFILVERAPTWIASCHAHENLLESYSCKGVKLGEHLLCKHAFISPKSLNRRLLTVQTSLLVGLLIGLHKLKGSLSEFGQTLRRMGSIESVQLKTWRPGRSKFRAVSFGLASSAKRETSELARQDSNSNLSVNGRLSHSITICRSGSFPMRISKF